MFKMNDELKNKLQDFWNNEIEEIKQNKIRFITLIFCTFIAFAFWFTDEKSEEISLNEPVQVEESNNVTQEDKTEENKISSNNEVISVKSPSSEVDGVKIVSAIGANSEKLYVGDPFKSEETNKTETKKEITKTAVTPSENPPIQLSPIPSQQPVLPPIPEMNQPIIVAKAEPPPKAPQDEFILTGTAIGETTKAALIKKISSSQGNIREEDIILSVGDTLQGRQITDITRESVIFDDGGRIYASNFEGYISIRADDDDEKISDTTENEEEILLSNGDFSETENSKIIDIPPIPEKSFYNLPDTQITEITEDIQTPPETENIVVPFEDNSILISDINSDFTETENNVSSEEVTTNLNSDDSPNVSTADNPLTTDNFNIDATNISITK